MVEQLIIGLVFLAAVVYLARLVWQQFRPKEAGCPKGCGSCSAVDFKKIEAEIARKEKAI